MYRVSTDLKILTVILFLLLGFVSLVFPIIDSLYSLEVLIKLLINIKNL